MTSIDLESNVANLKGNDRVDVIPNARVDVIPNAGDDVIPNAEVNNIPKARVDVIRKAGNKRLQVSNDHNYRVDKL